MVKAALQAVHDTLRHAARVCVEMRARSFAREEDARNGKGEGMKSSTAGDA